MKKLTATKFYSGHDPDTGHDVQAKPGQTIEVSDKKHEQLQRDYPKSFEEFEGVREKAAPAASEPEVGNIVKDSTDEILLELFGNVVAELKERDIDPELIAAKVPELAGAAGDGESDVDLSELGRKELNKKAAELGIEKPDKIRGGIPKVIEAIEAKQAEQADGR